MIYQGLMVGDYIINDELGRGGFGSVYLAAHKDTGKDVAIKFLHPKLLKEAKSRQSFLDEMINQARLSICPNIVHVHQSISYVDNQGEHLGMVMEYIDGDPLDLWVERFGLLPHFVAIPLFIQVLKGVGFAHSIGMLHRDIKPGNLLVSRNGMVKVTDFGLSKMIQGVAGAASESARAASLNYVAPERLEKKQIDNRSDIYSLGATFYEALTGNPPYDLGYGDWETAREQHRSGLVKRISDFCDTHPEALNQIVLKALNPEPDMRFHSCEEMNEALLDIWDKNEIPVGIEPLFQAVAVMTQRILSGEERGDFYHTIQKSGQSEAQKRALELARIEKKHQEELEKKREEARESIDRLIATGHYKEALGILQKMFDISEEFAAHRLPLLTSWIESQEKLEKAEKSGSSREVLAALDNLLCEIPAGEGRDRYYKQKEKTEQKRNKDILCWKEKLESCSGDEKAKVLEKLIRNDDENQIEKWKKQLEMLSEELKRRFRKKTIVILFSAIVLVAFVLFVVFYLPGFLLNKKMAEIESLLLADPEKALVLADDLLRNKDTSEIRQLHERVVLGNQSGKAEKMMKEADGLVVQNRFDEAMLIMKKIREDVFKGGTVPENVRNLETDIKKKAHTWWIQKADQETDPIQKYIMIDNALEFQNHNNTRQLKENLRLNKGHELLEGLLKGISEIECIQAKQRIRLLLDLAPQDVRVLKAREQVNRRCK